MGGGGAILDVFAAKKTGADKAIKKAGSDLLNQVTQVASGGLVEYKDGKARGGGYGVDAAKEGIEVGMDIYSDIVGGPEVPAESMDIGAPEDVTGPSDKAAAEQAAKDKALAETAKLDERRRRADVGSNRSANLLKNPAKTLSDDDELSVASLLA